MNMSFIDLKAKMLINKIIIYNLLIKFLFCIWNTYNYNIEIKKDILSVKNELNIRLHHI